MQKPQQDHTSRRSWAWKPGHNLWLIALTVTLATFMEVLDTSIANVALPHIAGGLAASQDESTWVLTSYLVSNAIVLPLSGWLSSVFGRKRFYMTCVALFTVSSFLCGIAPSLASAHLLSGLAGSRRRRPAAQRAGHPGRHFPARQARHGVRRLRHGRGGRAGDRADARRLDHRQLQLALDLLHQHPLRRTLSLLLTSLLVADPPWLKGKKSGGIEGGLHRLRPARAGSGRAAGRSRQRRARRLVFNSLYRRSRCHCRHLPDRRLLLGTAPQKSHHRSPSACRTAPS